MTEGTSLLESVGRLLRRTYRIRVELDVGRFVIGDHGYRRLYGGPGSSIGPGSWGGEARTLVRETRDGVRACIYYPDRLIRSLESHPPQRGIGERNVDPFATLVEELDHLLCIADRAAKDQPLTLFELELHANVSKHLVLARFLAGRSARLSAPDRAWLRYHLFDKHAFCDEDPAVRARYHDAARWAVRLLDAIERLDPRARVDVLRRFHEEAAPRKLRLIEDVAA